MKAMTDTPPGTDETDLQSTSAMGSAHPPIELLSPEITPETLATLLRVTEAELAIYNILYQEANRPNQGVAQSATARLELVFQGDPNDPSRGARLVFDGRSDDPASWLAQAPDHADLLLGRALNSAETVQALAMALQSETPVALSYAAETDPATDRLDLMRLLHMMEGAGIGRPSTYAGILDAVTETLKVLAIAEGTSAVSLTPNGAQMAELLCQHGGGVGSVDYNHAFSTRLEAVSEGEITAAEFLTWVAGSLGQTAPPAAAMWESVADLASGAPEAGTASEARQGGVISTPHAPAANTTDSA